MHIKDILRNYKLLYEREEEKEDIEDKQVEEYEQ
jgi:hypothetical protein